FTYVDNAVLANMLALFTDDARALNQVYNVACGEQTSLNALIGMLRDVSGRDIKAEHGPERPGDVRHSRADITRIKTLLGYEPVVYFREGLGKIFEWYSKSS